MGDKSGILSKINFYNAAIKSLSFIDVCALEIIAQIAQRDAVFCKISLSVHMYVIRPTVLLNQNFLCKTGDGISFPVKSDLIFPVDNPSNQGIVIKKRNFFADADTQQSERIV